MPAFQYQALDPRGRAVKGVLDADAERQVRSMLRERGLTPLRVDGVRSEAVRAGDRPSFSFRRRGMSGADLALVTRQFATLVRAGLPLEECLSVLTEQTEAARARATLASIRSRVVEGQSLARAMANFPNAFPDIYRAMIDAGEQTGKLVEVLDRLADYTENRQALRSKVLLAFIYPAIVTLVAVVVVSFLLIFVVPQVTQVFVTSGQKLPLITRVLLEISGFARATWQLWLVALVAGSIGAYLALRRPAIRHRWHGFLLRVPVVGRLQRGINAARFADTLGILTASGIPLLPALQSAVQVVTNLPMRAAVEDALRQVSEGGSLSRALGRAKLFPPLVVHLIASGEASGNLDMMLIRAAEAQARELENWVRTLTALLEPVLILVMGLVVMFIVVSILLPIFEMNKLIR